MVKSKKQMFIVIAVFILIIAIGSISYAFFNYSKTGEESTIIAGDIYFRFNEGDDEIELLNVFPETKEEARNRDDNYITFSLTGLNTSNKTIYYEIILDHGDEKPSPKSRYDDSDLMFDLVEIDSSGNEITYVVDGESYESLINKRIWVDTIDANTTTEIAKRYKLRAWLREDIIISDSEANANYTTTEYPNKYATIKVRVNGDFTEKEIPTGLSMVKASIAAKESQGGTCENITWTDPDDDVIYFSGTNDCVDMNYVWY